MKRSPSPVCALLAAGLVWAGCSGTQFSTETAAGADVSPASMPTSDSTTARAIPPIDAQAPAEYQTATFALG